MNDDDATSVMFGNARWLALVGVIGGVAFALGGAYLVLTLGTALDKWVMDAALFGALVLGALVALTATFFGIVIPSHVGDGGWRHACRRECRDEEPVSRRRGRPGRERT